MSKWVIKSWLVEPAKASADAGIEAKFHAASLGQPGSRQSRDQIHDLERCLLTNESEGVDANIIARSWYFIGDYYAQLNEWNRAYEAWYLCANACLDSAQNFASLIQAHYRLAECSANIAQHVQAYYSYGQVIAALRNKQTKPLKFAQGDAEGLLSHALLHRAYSADSIYFPEQAKRDLDDVVKIISGWTSKPQQKPNPSFMERAKGEINNLISGNAGIMWKELFDEYETLIASP